MKGSQRQTIKDEANKETEADRFDEGERCELLSRVVHRAYLGETALTSFFGAFDSFDSTMI